MYPPPPKMRPPQVVFQRQTRCQQAAETSKTHTARWPHGASLSHVSTPKVRRHLGTLSARSSAAHARAQTTILLYRDAHGYSSRGRDSFPAPPTHPAQRATPPKAREQHPHPLQATLPSPTTALKRREEEKEATHLPPFPLVMEPAFALPPLVVLVVLPSFSVVIAGFPIVCWWSSGQSRFVPGRKGLHAKSIAYVSDRARMLVLGAWMPLVVRTRGSRYCARTLARCVESSSTQAWAALALGSGDTYSAV